MHYIQKNNVLSLEFYHHPTENSQTQSPTSKLILAKPGNDFLMQNKHRCFTLRQLARTRWDMGDAQLCKWRCLVSHVLFCGCCRYCLQRRIRGLRDVAASTNAYCLTWRPVPVLGTMSPHGRREEWTLNTILWPLLLQMDAHMHRNMLAKRNINWQKKKHDSSILKHVSWLWGCRHIELILVGVCRSDTFVGHQHDCFGAVRKNHIWYVSKAVPFLSVIYWFLPVRYNINDYINYKKVGGKKVSNLFH